MSELVDLEKDVIDGIFEQAENQFDYWVALYRTVYPEWDEIRSIDGHPQVSTPTNEYLFEKAIAFDKKNHSGVQCGGLWLNKGFECADGLPDWKVMPAPAVMHV
ncbi:hypothetical protein ES705_20561 [subsurface metagenome]